MSLLDETRASTPVPAELVTGFHHLELWVGNARAVAHLLATGFGFTIDGYVGPETGSNDRSSYLLTQGDVRFVVTAALGSGNEIAEHVRSHGDGVKHVALTTVDPDAVTSAAMARGARAAGRHAIRSYGETVHRFLPAGMDAVADFSTDRLPRPAAGAPVGLTHIDHVVGNVEDGHLPEWVGFYEDTLGFTQMTHFDRDQISTEFSALRSTVVWNGGSAGGNGAVVMPINEPAAGRKRSQIQEYLDSYGAPGVQHVALATEDIVTAVASLADRGIRFLTPPATYYNEAKERLSDVDLPWAELERLGILVDREASGHLLQVFTEPIGDRPTLFFEVIQREGANGFGEGNFKALFEAIEREQERRGNL